MTPLRFLKLDWVADAAIVAVVAALIAWHFHAVSSAKAEGRVQGAAEVTAKWDKERQRITAAALAASEQARQKEAAYGNAVQATRNHFARESAITAAAVARAGRELERLRSAVASAPAGSGLGRCGGAGISPDARELSAAVDATRTDAGASTAGVLLLACSGELRAVAQSADELGDQVRGLHRHVDTLLSHIAGQPPVQGDAVAPAPTP